MKRNQDYSKEKESKAKPLHFALTPIDKLAAIALLSGIIFGLLYQGLMFEFNTLYEILWIGFLGTVYLVWFAFQKNNLKYSSIPCLLAVLFLLAYIVSLYSPISMRSAVFVCSKYLCVLIVIFLSQNIKRTIPLQQLFIKATFIAGILVALFGLDAVWGGNLASLINFIWAGGQPVLGQEFIFNMLDPDARLSSLFQYPNTTGAFLLMTWLIGVELWSRSNKRIYRQCIGMCTGIIMAALILTLSRGTYVMTLPIVLIYIMLLCKEDRRISITNIFSSTATGLFIAFLFIPGTSTRSIGVLGYPLGFCIAFGFSLIAEYANLKLAAEYKDVGKENTANRADSKYRKIMVISLVAIATIVLAGIVAAWKWSEPIQFDRDQVVDIERNFSLDAPGTYHLEFVFAEPLPQDTLKGIKISLETQTILDSKDHYEPISISTMADSEIGPDNTLMVPFDLKISKFARQRLIITGAMGKTANLLTDLRITDSTGNIIKRLRLDQKFLSEPVGGRIEKMLSMRSAYVRFSFYLDALSVIKDYWLTGAGGGAWEHIYTMYQSHKYVSKDVHSYGLQIAVETGIPGVIALMCLFSALIYKFVDLWRCPNRDQLILWLGAIVLLGHGMIDFDFAFYSILLIFWISIALLEFPEIRWAPAQKGEAKVKAIARERSWKSMSSYAALILLILITIYWPFRFLLGVEYAEQYMRAAGERNASVAEQAIRKAIECDPLQAEYKVVLAKLIVLRSQISQETYDEGNLLAAEAGEQAKYQYSILQKLFEYYQKSAQWQSAYETISQINLLRPLDPEAWEFKGHMIQNALQWYSSTDKVDDAERQKQLAQWFQRGLAIPAEMEAASLNKLETVTASPELEALLAQWTAQKAELTAQ